MDQNTPKDQLYANNLIINDVVFQEIPPILCLISFNFENLPTYSMKISIPYLTKFNMAADLLAVKQFLD